jgi:hypothetical protein
MLGAALGLALALMGGEARAAQYYAATTGSPAGSGSIGDPWDLQTALNGGKPTGTLLPGDTVWVRGGLYLAPVTSHLRGTPLEPIVVRNYPGERVVLDAQYANCDPNLCPPEEWQDAHPFFPACVPGVGLNHQCNAYNGINPCDTTTNPACAAPFNYRVDTLTIPHWSHDVWIWGFDLANYTYSPRGHIPDFCTPENPTQECCYPGGVLHEECFQPPQIPQTKASPIVIEGDRFRLINSFVHDGSTGVSWWTPSADSEVYGSFVFHSGYAGAIRGMYHGCYTQNVDTLDAPSEHAFRETAFFSNFGLGMQIYGSCGPADRYTLEGVISFSTTLPSKAFYTTTDPLVVPASKATESQDSILIHSNLSSHHAVVRETYVYNPMEPVGMPSFDFGSLPLNINGITDALVEDSVFVGDGASVRLQGAAQLRFEGNTVVGRTWYPYKEGSVTIIDPHYLDHLPLHHFASNTYYRTDAPPVIGLQEGGVGGTEFSVSLPTWQTTYGQDLDSFGYAGRPIVNQIFVRPNAYEPGRGHVVIYNWANLTSVPVDLSPLGLTDGQGFKVHNIQSFKTDPMAVDWMGNVAASGTFDTGNPLVNVDMTDTEMVMPIGFGIPPLSSTLPEFGVFVVMPQ